MSHSREFSSYREIYAIVRLIPRGRVATYGQVAKLADLPGQARLVGYSLHGLGADTTVPWHRVINARGEISRRGDREWERFQQTLLEEEGVEFSASGRLDLARYRWSGDASAQG